MPTQQWISMDAARHKQEIAQMEAYDVPRASCNGNLRTAFQAGQGQEAGMVAPSSTASQYVAAGKTKLSLVTLLSSALISQSSGRQNPIVTEQHQRYSTEPLRLVPSRSFRITQSIPVHRTRKPINASIISKEHEWGNIPAQARPNFSDEVVQPSPSSSDSEDTIVEPESTLIVYKDQSTENQELRRRNRNSGSSYAPSIHMTVNKPVLQHNHRQRPHTPNEEEDVSFDGLRNAREHTDHFKRSSCHSEWEEGPGPSGTIVPNPPVLRKAASWIADKLQSRADQIAGAVGLRPIRKTRADCRDEYCKVGCKK